LKPAQEQRRYTPTIAQAGDEVHALIGHRDVEPVRGAPHQRLRQRAARVAV